jgi:hypothetical protein
MAVTCTGISRCVTLAASTGTTIDASDILGALAASLSEQLANSRATMDKATTHPISFSVEIRTFPKPGSIQHLTLETAEELHGFSSSVYPFTIRSDEKTTCIRTQRTYEHN